jgi:toxin ParE1/3/4
MRRLDVARHARRDIDSLLWKSRSRHGVRAAERYRRLIDAAFADLRMDPARPAANPLEGTPLWLYALRHSARRLAAALRVHEPPHMIAYRFDDEHVLIVRVLHEAMDLPRHLGVAAEGDGDD